VIVALWAVVLVPMWIRRHDAANETRSADRFSQAMRTLSPRPGTTGQRDLVMPARPDDATRLIVSGVADPRAAARDRLARRRRRVLLALVATVAVLAGVAAFGVVPWWVVAVPTLLLMLYLANLRIQAKRSRDIRRSSRRSQAAVHASERAASRQPATDPSVVVETKANNRMWQPVQAADPAVGHLIVEEVVSQRLAQPPQRAAAGAEESDQPTQVIATAPADDGTWQPVEFPLPTYVTAPKATRPVRVIDLTSPGAWTSGRFLDEDLPQADDAIEQAVAQADEAADELSALLDRRPAVND
jgi:hypothetical protein